MATAKQRAWRAKFARLYGGKKRSSSTRRARTRTRVRRIGTMARRRYGRRYGRRRGRRNGTKFFGLGTKGLIGGLGLLGVAAGAMFGETIGGYIPVVNQQSNLIKGAAGGFIVGGPAGAVGNVVKQYVMGGTSTTTTW